MKNKSKYAALESEMDVERWLRSLALGSPVASEVARRRLGKACELLALTPKSMVERAEKYLRGFQDMLEDFDERLEALCLSPELSSLYQLSCRNRAWLLVCSPIEPAEQAYLQ